MVKTDFAKAMMHLSKIDKNGISNHYWDYNNNIKDKWKRSQDGINELEKKIEKIKKDGSGKEFDCILGLRGGADSSYMLHVVVKKFNLKPFFVLLNVQPSKHPHPNGALAFFQTV